MKENKDTISRRKFFRKAAGLVLPAIAISVLPTLFSSCEIDEPYPGGDGSGCSECSGKCTGSCSGGCYQGCSGQCGLSNCTNTCMTGCDMSCKGSCKRTSK